jgi:hypothetical protein
MDVSTGRREGTDLNTNDDDDDGHEKCTEAKNKKVLPAPEGRVICKLLKLLIKRHS